jgi:hypothetical protein
MHPADLETFVDGKLKELPTPQAPRSLLPRVLASVQAWTLRPWYTRAWLAWPLGWQVVSIAALALLLVASAIVMPSAQAAAGGVGSALASGPIGEMTAIARRADLAINAVRVLWHALVEPLVAYAFALVVVMCLACAAFVTALNRVAFGRVFQS